MKYIGHIKKWSQDSHCLQQNGVFYLQKTRESIQIDRFFSLCRRTGFKFSLREVTNGTKYRAFCLNTDAWYGHTEFN